MSKNSYAMTAEMFQAARDGGLFTQEQFEEAMDRLADKFIEEYSNGKENKA